MPLFQRTTLAIALTAAPLLAIGQGTESPSGGHAPTDVSFSARAWADNEYLADRDAGQNAARRCTKANGNVISVHSESTYMLGDGTWQATARAICRKD
ncbi:hypothetical protein [Pinirhizobacter soli]|uniref:hypothetical protein n=1 Tax=Pinirhizobacter soli TaxID=2786953 RepID=UPI00202A89B5|nr:hypothetical protein [Pinirhizobacter soli]